MRILITGGCGFVGSHLSEALLAAGHRVVALDDLSTGRLENVAPFAATGAFEVVEGSVLDVPLVERLVGDADVVFHMAAAVGVELIISEPLRVLETNILGTHAVLKAADEAGAKVLLASTSEIYGKSDALPFSEEGNRLLGPTTRWRWCYSTSKAADEYLAFAYHRQRELPVVVFRLFNTVGPRQRGHYGMVVPRLVELALQGRPLTVYGDGNQSRTFCDVRDAVRALLGLMESEGAVGGVFNVGSTGEISIRELAERILEEIGVEPSSENIHYVPYDRAYEEGFEDMVRRAPDLTRIQQLLGWAPEIPLRETLRAVIEERRRKAGNRDVTPTGEAADP
jgi:UDP-glucose 4-epimerase